MLTVWKRMNVEDRFLEYCHDKGIDETPKNVIDWLAMMGLLDEESINDLPDRNGQY